MSIHSFKANNIRGQEIELEQYKDKVVLIVNTASKCGYTPQFSSLQKLYETYKDQGLVILGFPCNQFAEQDPESNEKIDAFCLINYGVSFPLFEKIEVVGDNKLPLFAYLTEQQPFQGFDQSTPKGKSMHEMLSKHAPEKLLNNEIKWNFTKFLINREGEVVGRYESPVEPLDIGPAIEALLK